jgi:hypothetical protein
LEYAFPTDTTARASTVRYDWSALTVYIPENASRNFVSVVVEVTFLDNSNTAVTLTSWTIGVNLAAAGFSDITRTPTCRSTTNEREFVLVRDFTAYFNANFGSGTSQTCQVGVAITGFSRINTTAKLIITYQYNDSAQTTRIKMAKIPLDSANTGSLSSSLAELGTSQVPNLSTFLPENSVVYRQKYFEITYNETPGSTTNSQLGMQLDSESEVNDGTHNLTLSGSTGRYCVQHWVRDDMSTSATHAIKFRTTSTNGIRPSWISVVLVVIYEYNHTNSTRILNSLQMCIANAPDLLDGNTATDKHRSVFSFDVVEPGTITLLQSGVKVHSYSAYATANDLIVSCGAQSERTYSGYASLCAGGFDCIIRVDSAAALGAGVSLARGSNSITFNARRGQAGQSIYGLDAVLYLNYTSDKATLGADTHNHTIYFCNASSGNDAVESKGIQNTFFIPETYYRFVAADLAYFSMPQCDTTNGLTFVALAEILSTDPGSPGEGWRVIGPLNVGNGYQYPTIRRRTPAVGVYYDSPNSASLAQGLLDPQVARYHRVSVKTTCCAGYAIYCTYHSQTWATGGNAVNFAGDGSGMTACLHRASDGELLYKVTTGVGGIFSTIVYNDTELLYWEMWQDSTHVGRTDNSYPTTVEG